jgi:hypothetical protein
MVCVERFENPKGSATARTMSAEIALKRVGHIIW